MSAIVQTIRRFFGKGNKQVEDSLAKAGLTITQHRTFAERMQEREFIMEQIRRAKSEGDPLALIEAYDDLVHRVGIPFHRIKDTPHLSRGIGAWDDQAVRAIWMCHWLPYSQWTPEMKATAGWEGVIAKRMEEEEKEMIAKAGPDIAEQIHLREMSKRATLVAAIVKLLEADAKYIVDTSFAGRDTPGQIPIVIHNTAPMMGGSPYSITPTDQLPESYRRPPDEPLPGKVPRRRE
jgi:hypothetical protein